MKRRESLFLVAGLIVGLLFGMVLIGTSDDLREAIFGTVASKGTDVNHYLVTLEDAQVWLADEYPESSEAVKESFDTIARLPVGTLPNLNPVSFQDAEVHIQSVLPQAYAVLVGDKDAASQPGLKASDQTAVCLGVDENPYADERLLYLYLTIPSEKLKSLKIPPEWEKLENPKTNVLYWKLLACFPEPDMK